MAGPHEQHRMLELDRIDDLLQNRHVNDAMIILNGMNAQDLTANEKARYSLLSIFAKLIVGNYHEVDEEIESILRFYESERDDLNIVRTKYYRAWLYTLIGDFANARNYLWEVYILSRNPDLYRWQAAALNRLAYISHEIGDTNVAADYMKECISLYERFNDKLNHLIVSVNLGAIYYCIGRLKDSIIVFEGIKKETLLALADHRLIIFRIMYPLPIAALGDVKKALRMIGDCPFPSDLYKREQVL